MSTSHVQNADERPDTMIDVFMLRRHGSPFAHPSLVVTTVNPRGRLCIEGYRYTITRVLLEKKIKKKFSFILSVRAFPLNNITVWKLLVLFFTVSMYVYFGARK